MKRYHILSILFICMLLGRTLTGIAQQANNDALADKIKAAQIAYMTQKLDLTPDEAQKFWPVYNQYFKEVEILVKERKEGKENRALSSTDDLNYEQRLVNIKTRYNKEFLKVLSPSKTRTVFRSEREFHEILIQQLRDRQTRAAMRPGAGRFRQ